MAEARAKAALRRSAIFPLYSIDTYDFSYPKSIDRDVVMRASSLEFIREKSNVVFVGPAGVGKTHLSNAIGQLACLRGHRVRFVVAADLVNDLVAGQARNALHQRLSAWAAPDLLLIDELGHLSFDARGADLLYQALNKRYQRASTIASACSPFHAQEIALPAIQTPRFPKIVSTLHPRLVCHYAPGLRLLPLGCRGGHLE